LDGHFSSVCTFTQQILKTPADWLAKQGKVNSVQDAGFAAA
jgi:hypothetical protein